MLLDWAFGEPPAAIHPVVWMGRLLAALERAAPSGYHTRLVYGGIVAVVVPCLWATLAAWAVRHLPWPFQAVLLKTSFAGRALLAAGEEVEAALRHQDLPKARAAVRSLVSRPTAALDGPLMSAAAIESLAENFVDSWLAPVLMYRLGGLPLAFAYRAANTADATWGYRDDRYEALGKLAARLDDVLNFIPARLAALMLAVTSRDARASLAAWRRDASKTASPNSGQVMAAAAGALDVRLEKVDHYVLNASARSPGHADIARARQLVTRAMFATAAAYLVTSR
jgi:adenosylcobinamide-phosphate synthase